MHESDNVVQQESSESFARAIASSITRIIHHPRPQTHTHTHTYIYFLSLSLSLSPFRRLIFILSRALFSFEVGPASLQQYISLTHSPGSWVAAHTLLYTASTLKDDRYCRAACLMLDLHCLYPIVCTSTFKRARAAPAAPAPAAREYGGAGSIFIPKLSVSLFFFFILTDLMEVAEPSGFFFFYYFSC